MRQFAFSLIFITLGISALAADTTGIVKGKVFDLITGEPLAGASIIFGNNRGTVTGDKGDYLIRTRNGTIVILFKFIGYKTATRTILVFSPDTIELNVSLEKEINEIDQIVVSANRREQKVSESTVSLSIIRPDILEKNQITHAEDLINRTSGIEVLDGQASIRGGSGFSYGAGSRVLALIDGLPVLAADAGNIKWQFLPLENLSQIEIIKGAASVLYGSSALNGIINFRTADAADIPVTHFFIETGIYDKPQQKKWIWWNSPRIFSAASFSHLQKHGKTDLGISASIMTDNGYRKLNDEKLGRMSLSIKHHDQKHDGLIYGLNINSGLTEKRDFLLWENADSGALKQDVSTAVEFHGNFLAIDPFVSLKKTNSYRHELRMRIQSSQNKFPDNPRNNSDALSWYAEYQAWNKINDFLSINYGLSENLSRIISNFYGNHNGLNIAGLSQLDLTPFNRLKIIAGIRLEYNSLDEIRDKLVPVFRTGINYRLSQTAFLRTSFGQGYRYPSIAEKYASTTLGAVKIYPNTSIKPESGWSTEIGIKQGIPAGKLNGQVDFSVFYSNNSELIEYIFGQYLDHNTGEYGNGFMASNAEHSRVYGLEPEFMLTYSGNNYSTNLSGGYVYMVPVEFDPLKNQDIYLKYRRKHSGKLSLSTTYKKLDFGLDMFVRSKILNIDNVFLNELTRESILPGFYDYWNANNKAYLLMDCNFGYTLNQKFRISMVVKNLSNTEYMGRPGDIRPQRSFGLRFSGQL